MDPLVSIVIPVYNGSNYMREAIDSALSQTYSNIEIIVVNDGSNDGGKTREVALSYGDKIRYFEKENGGVSTALNLGIKNMRGQYFSWLSHDDIYYPDKVQTEIDALRAAGDMSRIVHSNWCLLIMSENRIVEYSKVKEWRQSFLETGAFPPIFQFIDGCTPLIPKIYFDAYGGFDEKYRAVQDYIKWFEMFRGKRLIYIRKPLVISRLHAEQTGRKYNKVREEEDWLYGWMTQNVDDDDLVGSGLVDMYHFYSAVFSRWINYFHLRESTIKFAFNKMKSLPETPDTDERVKVFVQFFQNLLNQKPEVYFLKNEEQLINLAFSLRGVNFGAHERFITPEQIQNISSKKEIRLMRFDDITQWLIDTPIRKELLEKMIKID